MTASRTTHLHIDRAFDEGRSDPIALAKAALEAVEQSRQTRPQLGAFVALDAADVESQARSAAARREEGETRGPLDGIPVAIKDEFDVTGYPTTVGTTFRGREPAEADSLVVERLRQAGAIIFGKTSLTEIGLGGTGLNPGQITPRNPYDLERFTGGSSSGSAAAVSAGVVPMAVGSDAGGSVRIPAAICGIYGFKPTFGRIPTTGAELLAWTLDHVGPLAASLEDIAAFYDAVAGADGVDLAAARGPKPRPLGASFRAPRLASLRFAWCADFADDAEPEVAAAFHRAVDHLRDAGATVEEVELRWVRQIQQVGYVTLAVEAAASQRDWLREHRADYNLDTRLLLAVAERFSAVEYLHAQRVRELIRRELAELLARYDAFLSPTVACTARVIPKDALETGVVDSAWNSAVSRYTFAANLTGTPAISLPCGTDGDGMPVGLQLMGPAWADERLLRIAKAVDDVMPRIPEPGLYYDLLAQR